MLNKSNLINLKSLYLFITLIILALGTNVQIQSQELNSCESLKKIIKNEVKFSKQHKNKPKVKFVAAKDKNDAFAKATQFAMKVNSTTKAITKILTKSNNTNIYKIVTIESESCDLPVEEIRYVKLKYYNEVLK